MNSKIELSPAEDAALATVVSLLSDLTADYDISIPHDPYVELQGSLGLDSIDVTQLSSDLQSHYGPTVNLAEYCSRLDLDAIYHLSLGDIARYVTSVHSPGAS
ncbi:phosphopantetheine-binding protein [Pinirhizobacter soli]|uniref:phosphopantetheine-binding protein n=1 Tax=Pinirhizobacter soli TaxID=2786953 RepID=UPI00202A37E2|nr:phosphopantetheine-binding protein [Pinirhizobacter soli]